jgi:hypothetical protein
VCLISLVLPLTVCLISPSDVADAAVDGGVSAIKLNRAVGKCTGVKQGSVDRRAHRLATSSILIIQFRPLESVGAPSDGTMM